MARMSNLERLGAALAAQQSPLHLPGRAPGDAASDELAARREALRMAVGGISVLPPTISADDIDNILILPTTDEVRTKYISSFCNPPPFYCEQERTEWAVATPWCPANAVPLVTVPTFTSDVERNAWIATHQNCPVPPPVPPPLTNHMCTPGEPGCVPTVTPATPATPASTTPAPSSNGAGTFAMGAAAMALVWWWTSLDKPRANPDRPSALDRLEGLYQRALAADTEFSRLLHKKYGSSAGDMRYQTSKQPPAIRAAGKQYQEAIDDFVKARRAYMKTHERR